MGLFGSSNKSHIKQLSKMADTVMALEEKYAAMTDDELKQQTVFLKKRLKAGETLDQLLPDAFAVVREAAFRVLKMKPFKTQVMGGIALHQGRIAEMKTGEGKTLVSTMPSYLNALSGKGVHVITVNEYLAKRDAEWMGKVHRFLGLTVGVAASNQQPQAKKNAYLCDITYCTNNEVGFDYLRDNIVTRLEDRVLRGLEFAIVDEVDSILIDEARTPLIISGPTEKSSENYVSADRFVKSLKKDDYNLDEKDKVIRLTDSGVNKAEKFFNIENLGDLENIELNHFINNALKAHVIMKLDDNYVVDNGEIKIVDEFTGRVMEGRRYSDGLHQAIEAKEGVHIKEESKTLATITFQNLFRLYKKLSGMTGTAKTEEDEFNHIYNLDVVVIPTNVPVQRKDENDVVYVTPNGKLKAVVEDTKIAHAKGQPVLIGTVTIERSEQISKYLKEAGLRHNVLNAKNHMLEGEIIAQAGRLNAITIATNMAGRGTDILLGGNPEYLAKKQMREEHYDDAIIDSVTAYKTYRSEEEEKAKAHYDEVYAKFKTITEEEKKKVIEAGGLRIIGTERHESRRIDNQLRGRSGRQGDAGQSVFYLSLQDDLIRRFGGDYLQRVASFFKLDDTSPFKMKFLSHRIEGAQKRIEGVNFSQRRHTVEYDDVLNKQRALVYEQRNKILNGEDIHESVVEMIKRYVSNIVYSHISDEKNYKDWNIEELNTALEQEVFDKGTNVVTEKNIVEKEVEDVVNMVNKKAIKVFEERWATVREQGVDCGFFERIILLQILDDKWIDHIESMTYLKNGIQLRGYGQHDPLVEFKKESYEIFQNMLDSVSDDMAKCMLRTRIEVQKAEPIKPIVKKSFDKNISMSGGGSMTKEASSNTAVASKEKTVGRNDPCPCGSGKKYKHCCGSNN